MLAQLGALWLIVGTGAAVRLTDSGLGCRAWPGCETGHPLPAKDAHAFVEFGNRLVGGVTIVVTLLAWLAVRRVPGLSLWVRRIALAVFLGTLAQAPIGLLAIASDLRWPIVMVHLLLSIALLAGATILVLEVRAAAVGPSRAARPAGAAPARARVRGRRLRAHRQRSALRPRPARTPAAARPTRSTAWDAWSRSSTSMRRSWGSSC